MGENVYVDGKGHFRRGNPGGGRKSRAEEEEIKAALNAEMPISEVVKRLAQCVLRRQSWAIQLWLAYMWGRPKERVDADITSRTETLSAVLVSIQNALGVEGREEIEGSKLKQLVDGQVVEGQMGEVAEQQVEEVSGEEREVVEVTEEASEGATE